MVGAIQPRINKAIEDRLRADTVANPQASGTSLQALLQSAGALLGVGLVMPIFWERSPAPAIRPYIVYGPQDPQTTLSAPICGIPYQGEVSYQIRYVLDGIDPAGGIDVIDRIATLLEVYAVSVSGGSIIFFRTGEFSFPDFGAQERGVTVSGIVYRCHVGLG